MFVPSMALSLEGPDPAPSCDDSIVVRAMNDTSQESECCFTAPHRLFRQGASLAGNTAAQCLTKRSEQDGPIKCPNIRFSAPRVKQHLGSALSRTSYGARPSKTREEPPEPGRRIVVESVDRGKGTRAKDQHGGEDGGDVGDDGVEAPQVGQLGDPLELQRPAP